MWGILMVGLFARPWVRHLTAYALTALTIALFIINLRWTPPRAALVIAMISLSGCAKVGSDGSPLACPPVVEYSRAEQTQVADEVAALPGNALIVGWLADYAVLRAQVRACG